METWSPLKSPDRWLHHSLTTNTSRGHGNLNHYRLLELPTGVQSPWILYLKWKFTFMCQEDLWSLSSSPVLFLLFLLSPVKTLPMFLPVQVWLNNRKAEGRYTDMVHSLRSSWIKFSWQFSQGCSHPLACAHVPFPSYHVLLTCCDTALHER